jgi:hypothetical protein
MIAYAAVEYWSLDVFGIEFPPQTDGRLAQYKYLVVCTSLILVSVLATMIR